MNDNRFTKLGNFFNNQIRKAGNFLMKHPALYFLLNCTWGSLLTIMGLIITVILLPFSGFKIRRYNNIYYLRTCFKGYWGFEMGLMFVVAKDGDTRYLKNHEYGHTVQNAILGPFQLILVTIPSFLRYWYREIRELLGKPCRNDYDDIWFEWNATKLGSDYYFYEPNIFNTNKGEKK